MDFLTLMHKYFEEEVMESWIFCAVAVALLAAACVFFLGTKQPYLRGLGAVFVVTALIGLPTGGTVIARTPKQVAELSTLLETDASQFKETEGARMATVVKSFATYRYGFLASAAIGVIVLMLTGNPLWKGVGVGLLLFCAIGFTVDHYAESRAIWYHEAIQSLALP